MDLHFLDNAAFTVALALAAGMAGQALAHHARLPGIVLLLGIGIVLGPDVANVVQPSSLGDGLSALVGFAVAVILFEGGMSLDLRRLKREQRPIRQLITVGAAVSLAAGALLASFTFGWEWQRSLLFGTLVVVTGPTVVTPLLRRLRVKKTVSTVLEAEGVLIDAIGAITAAVALELVLRPTGESMALAAPNVAGRLAFGVVLGLVTGGLLALLLRFRNLVPEGLENPFTLGWAMLVFQVANAVVHESGIAAVTVAGLVVGNTRHHVRRELQEFKEQLTVILIGMLFVLLVADVRVADVIALGWRGAAVAAGCVLLVRPISVWAGTLGTRLARNERLFIAWIGPRGIVAAAVASLFGFELEHAGIEGGVELRALVFFVIAVTVLWSALTGGVVAGFLELKRKAGAGWGIVGGNALARQLGRLLQDAGAEVVLIDYMPAKVQAVEADGLRAIHGNALEGRSVEIAQLDTRHGAIALTENEEVNYLFAEKTRLRIRTLRYPVALTSWLHGVTSEMVQDMGGELLFGASFDISWWAEKVEKEHAVVRWWRFTGGRKRPSVLTGDAANPSYLPLVHRRKDVVEPVTESVRFRKHSEVAFLIDADQEDAIAKTLRDAGWEPAGRARSVPNGEIRF